MPRTILLKTVISVPLVHDRSKNLGFLRKRDKKTWAMCFAKKWRTSGLTSYLKRKVAEKDHILNKERRTLNLPKLGSKPKIRATIESVGKPILPAPQRPRGDSPLPLEQMEADRLGQVLAARHLQEAIVGSTLMYGSEIAWRGQASMSRAFQRSINRMSRSSLGVLSSTPVTFLQAEGGSLPAKGRLDRRQEAFAIRLASTTPGPHTSLLRGTPSSGLGQRIRGLIGQDILGQRVEVSRISASMSFPGGIELPPVWRKEEKEEREEGVRAAMEKAKEKEQGPDTIWTGGSKLEGGGVGAGVAWYEEETSEQGRVMSERRGFSTAGQKKERTGNTYHGRYSSFEEAGPGWRSRGFGMGGGHEAFDAELAALAYGLTHLYGRRGTGRAYTVFTDSTAAMRRVGSDAPGPSQEMAVHVIGLAQRIIDQGNYQCQVDAGTHGS